MSKTTKEQRELAYRILRPLSIRMRELVDDIEQDLEAAEAEIAKLREQTQWRPIETCDAINLNMEKVILWCESGAEVGTWFKHFGCWSDGRTELRKVTHWMPVQPPQAQESESE